MGFIRNSDGIIINTDDSQYLAIVAQRESEKKARELGAEVDSLRSELSEIRMLLANITNRKQNG